jgi:hypothetical protein
VYMLAMRGVSVSDFRVIDYICAGIKQGVRFGVERV